jgi:pimeloyl-ACP methyl ester carboxylesterase
MPRMTLNGIELYYQKYGHGEAVVVLLHGFLSSSKMWTPDYVTDLSRKYTVYSLDLRGHGNSSTVKIGCNLKQMASDIHQFVLVKKINRCTLAGMSMGAAVAIQFAIDFPDKLLALILMNPGPGSLFSRGFVFVRPVLSFVAQKKYLLRPFLSSALINPLPRSLLENVVEDAALVSKEIWLQYLHPDNKIHNFNRLSRLTIPVLVLIGEKDKAVPMAFQDKVADTIPRAVKVVLGDEGHAMVMEKPHRVLSEIHSFLNV